MYAYPLDTDCEPRRMVQSGYGLCRVSDVDDHRRGANEGLHTVLYGWELHDDVYVIKEGI